MSSFPRTTSSARYPATADAIEVRRFSLGISLLDCASQLGATVTARAYDRIRRVAGALREVVDELAEHYGFSYDEVQIAITPLSLIGHSLSAHDLVAVASAIDAAARDTRVDAVHGFSAIGPIDAHRGATALAKALPSIIASTERVHASLDYTTSVGDIYTPAAVAYSRVVREIGDISASTPGHFLRVAGAPYCPDTLLFHDVRKPDLVASVELSCLNEILAWVDEVDDDRDLTRIASDVQQIASRQYRAARFIANQFADAFTERSGMKVWRGKAVVTTAPVGTPEKRNLSLTALEELKSRSSSEAWTTVAAAAVDRAASRVRMSMHDSPMDVAEVGPADTRLGATADLGIARDLVLIKSDATTAEIMNAFVEHVLLSHNRSEPLSIVLAEEPDGNVDLPGVSARFLNGRAGNLATERDRNRVH